MLPCIDCLVLYMHCYCFCGFNLSFCFIPYMRSGTRWCSYACRILYFIAFTLYIHCGWWGRYDLNSSMATYISIQFMITFHCSMALLDLVLLWLLSLLWWIHFEQSAGSNLYVCIPFLRYVKGRLVSDDFLNAFLLMCHLILALPISPLRMHSSQHRWFNFANNIE